MADILLAKIQTEKNFNNSIINKIIANKFFCCHFDIKNICLIKNCA